MRHPVSLTAICLALMGATAGAQTAEPQVPSGKFTTAVEVKPILTATKGNWVAVREYDGRDLVYFTHLLAWRCGLVGLRFGLNDGPMVSFPLPACDVDAASPNALPPDGLPYLGFGLKSVDSVQVEITYDDLTVDTASFARQAILIP